jgi:four helix bundle protein
MLESHSLPILTRIFLHKLEIALEEARETQYWIDTLIESGLVEKPQFDSLLQEPKKLAKS